MADAHEQQTGDPEVASVAHASRRRLAPSRPVRFSGLVLALSVSVAAGCGSSDEAGSSVSPSWTTVELGQVKAAEPNGSVPRAMSDAGEVVGVAFLPPDEGEEDLPSADRPKIVAVRWTRGQEPVLLPTLGGRDSGADAINESGQIAGSSQTAKNENHAALWDKGEIRDLGPGAAVAISDNGIVVGRTLDGDGGFIWNAGRRSEFDFVPRAVNRQGQVVGFSVRYGERTAGVPSSWPWDFKAEPMIWENGKARRLPTPPEYPLGFADGINSYGVIAGVMVSSTGEHHLVSWVDGEMRDRGVIAPAPEKSASAYDSPLIEASPAFINDRGEVSVSTTNENDGSADSGLGAFQAEEDDFQRLPPRLRTVIGMNRDGEIVGDGADGAFVWTQGQLVQLPPDGSKPSPIAINDNGDIAGVLEGRPVVWRRER